MDNVVITFETINLCIILSLRSKRKYDVKVYIVAFNKPLSTILNVKETQQEVVQFKK